MQRMGHSVTVLSYAITEEDNFHEEEGVLIKRYNFQNVPVILVKHKKIPLLVSFDIFDRELEGIYEKIIIENKYDLIHVGHSMRNGSILKIAKKNKIPVILTLTDFWLMCPRGIAVTQNGRLCNGSIDGNMCIRECFGVDREDLIKQRVSEAHEILAIPKVIAAPSQFLATMFEECLPFKIKVVRHGIDYSNIVENNKKIQSDFINFGYIGTILPHKGVHIITQALSLIKNKNIKIKIYGNYFGETEYYQNLLNETKNDNRIVFMGEFKDNEMHDIMNSIDCSVCSSIWWENSPITILTSLAYKIPVITPNVGGSAEFIKNQENGFNFEIGNPESLAKSIINILNNPDQLIQIKNNIIRPRRIEEEAAEYENVYTEVTLK
jgi:glycosyltransferase involved in cell wall biosynthesis